MSSYPNIRTVGVLADDGDTKSEYRNMPLRLLQKEARGC